MPGMRRAVRRDISFPATDILSVSLSRANRRGKELAEDETVEEDGEDGEGDVDVEPVAFAGEAEH
jgi:hypothetical protein